MRLVIRGKQVEHWLNGSRVVEYQLGSPDWESRVRRSKFARMPRYGREPAGHIALQDHGDRVAFRNITIRDLSSPTTQWQTTPSTQEALMPDRVRKVNYCYPIVPNRAGQGARILTELTNAGINLLAYSGFPVGGGRAQLDLVVEDMGPLRRVARRNGWRLSKVKKGFLVQGTDQVGAVQRHLKKLADAGINVTAADAVVAGQGRYGMILWVKPRDYARAGKALGAR